MRTVIGVMGSGESGDKALLAQARDLGAAIATEGWVLLNGGRNSGVMDASAVGARNKGGFVIGILPDEGTAAASRHLDVAIRTGMGDGRNWINVLSSDVVIALRGGAGTLSEVALALKAGRTVITLDFELGVAFDRYSRTHKLHRAASVEEAIAMAKKALRLRATAPLHSPVGSPTHDRAARHAGSITPPAEERSS
ncbi:MAG: TIGR00725 family protein [Coriobacteriia bacterium]|nr:TIGR00725 family protein [Coriobacteriia bacterium]